MFDISSFLLWIMLAIFCAFLVAAGIRGNDFERKCEIACSPSRVITPIISGEESCLCDEGQGVWRRQLVDRGE